MAQIPERLVNFNVFGGTGATTLIGLATVELPKFDPMIEKIMGAGIAGEFDSPVLGHFQSMAVKLTFRTPTAEQLALIAPTTHRLDIRGSIQIQDPDVGVLTQPLAVEVRGATKSSNLGKLEVGKLMDAEVEVEVAFISVTLDGVKIIELDKFNNSFKVNGVDYLQSVRTDLGGV